MGGGPTLNRNRVYIGQPQTSQSGIVVRSINYLLTQSDYQFRPGVGTTPIHANLRCTTFTEIVSGYMPA